MPQLVIVPASAPANSQERWSLVPQATRSTRLLERIVYWADNAPLIPGARLRIGLDPVLGLVMPVVGDALGGVISVSVVLLALPHRLPVWVVAKMVGNLALDAAFGLVPGVGDLFDFAFRANQRNLALLRAHRRGPLPNQAPRRPQRPLQDRLALGVLVLVGVACATLPIVLSMGFLYALFNVGS